MRVWISAWIEPGKLVCAAAPASSSSCSRKSGLPSARSTQLATSAAGIVDESAASRCASSTASGPRSMPISGAPCSVVRHAPALGSPAKRVVITSSTGCFVASTASAASRSSVQGSAQWMSSTTSSSGAAAPTAATTSQSACSDPCSRAVVLIAAARARSSTGGATSSRSCRKSCRSRAIAPDAQARSIANRRAASSDAPSTPSMPRARLRTASRPVSAPKSSTGAA